MSPSATPKACARDAVAIEAQLSRITKTLSAGPSFSGKAALLDRLLSASRAARLLAENLRFDALALETKLPSR